MTDHVHVLDKGFVRLVDFMPRENLDASIVQAARVSYGDGTKTSRDDRGLIRYLLRHRHTTPFEMVEFKFHIKMPIFLARQHFRHRTASINELSARYSHVPDEYFEPQDLRGQSRINHQGSEGVIEYTDALREKVSETLENSFDVYDTLIDAECCREQARIVLPQATYTQFYWKINLHNLMHYLQLRLGKGAQKEIREYAQTIYDLIEPLVPITMEAFQDFRIHTITFSRVEIEYINNGTPIESKGEQRELEEKLKLIKLH